LTTQLIASLQQCDVQPIEAKSLSHIDISLF
jgi:hypothetical protein